jgi:hypothetical protein
VCSADAKLVGEPEDVLGDQRRLLLLNVVGRVWD